MAVNYVKKYKKLVDNSFIELVKDDLNFIIETKDRKKAFELASWIKQALDSAKKEMSKNSDIFNFYKKVIIKCRFIAMPILDEVDVIGLFKNYFTWHFRILNYDIQENFNSKLISINLYEDRDKLKEEVKKALIENNEVITNEAEIKNVKDWIKEYNSKLGLGLVDSLKKREFYVSLSKYKNLDENDIEKLKVLFDFYESLKYSSLSPKGHEEDVPIVIDGVFYVYKKGELEPVGEKTKKERIVVESSDKLENNNSLSPGVKKSVDSISSVKKTNTARLPRTDELRAMAEKYPAGSLERKAIEDEIRRIEGGG